MQKTSLKAKSLLRKNRPDRNSTQNKVKESPTFPSISRENPVAKTSKNSCKNIVEKEEDEDFTRDRLNDLIMQRSSSISKSIILINFRT